MGRWRAVAAVAVVGMLAPVVPMTVMAGPAASASFPGNNGPIAFEREIDETANGDIWLTSPDGAWMVQLTDDPADDAGPAVSPDGSRIAFASNRSGTYRVYVMANDGSGVVALNDSGIMPSWSPDGTRIVYAADGIWVMDADGSDQTLLFDGPGVEVNPTWSPDGTKIAYAVDFPDEGIYVMDADGTDSVLLTDETGADLQSSWSPDGTKIVFACDAGSPWADQLCTIAPDGTDFTLLTHDDGSLGVPMDPSWSPDGTKIVFRSSSGIGGQLNVMDADGTNAVQITEYTFGNWSPSWGTGTWSTTAITGVAPDPPITGLAYTVSGTVTVDPLRPDPTADLPGSVRVSDGATDCVTGAGPTGSPGEYAFSCTLTAGPPGPIDVTASYAAPGSDIVPSSATVSTTIIVMPGPPTNVSATVPGPGSRSTVVSWTPPPGPVPTGYQIRCIPVGLPAQTGPPDDRNVRWTGSVASPVVVTGLTRGVTYHCKVRARYGPEYTNEIGDRYEGPLSAWTNSFTVPIVAPPAPTSVRASTPVVPYPRTTIVQWSSPPNDTGAPITFTTRCTSPNGGATRTATGGPPAVVAALNRGNIYVCTVTAKNVAGSATSAPSNAVRVPR